MNKGTGARVVRILLVVVLVAVMLLWLLPVQRAIISGAVAVNMLVPSGDWRPLVWTTAVPVWRDIEVKTADGRNIVVRLYNAGPASWLGLVIYTPLIGGGLDDERLVNLASTWARAGIPVAVPWSDEGLVVHVNDIEEVITAVRVLQQETGVGQVGLFGISFGTGPVFAAGIDERLKGSTAFIVSLNGMYDVANIVEFIDSGRSHEYGREVLAATRSAGANLADVRQRLSPAAMVDRVTVPVYIIHSISDQFIPYAESVNLRDALQSEGKKAELILTDVIEHGMYRPPTLANIFEHYVPAGASFAALIYEILALR